MERYISSIWRSINIDNLLNCLRKLVYLILYAGPKPNHIAFIMDGNRRYAKRNTKLSGGHRAGFPALMSMLKYCYEFGVKYVTIYAFSIDNFKRSSEEVQSLMDLLVEKIEELLKEESIVNRYGLRLYFSGNLDLVSERVKSAVERAMLATAKNSTAVLTVCIAYTSTNEIVHAVQESCEKKRDEKENLVKLEDIEKKMYMAVVPDPDIIIRTSGETRLSNFLLWQSPCSSLYSPSVLWPEIGFRHFLWAVLNFQRNFLFLDRKKKLL